MGFNNVTGGNYIFVTCSHSLKVSDIFPILSNSGSSVFELKQAQQVLLVAVESITATEQEPLSLLEESVQ